MLAGLVTRSNREALTGRELARSALEDLLLAGGLAGPLRAALYGLARIEPDGIEPTLDEPGLRFHAEHYLSQIPETQEAAILSLGIAEDPAAIPRLSSLLRDDGEGRELLRGPVGVRNRAFAAFALGLIGRASEDQAVRLLVVHALFDALANERTATPEIQVACVAAAALVDLEYCGDDPVKLERHMIEGDHHLCGGVEANYLLDALLEPTLGDELRAHAARSIGRLGAAAPEAQRAGIGRALMDLLAAKETPADVRRGVVIGLGLFADGDDDELDVEVRERLAATIRKSEALCRRLALIALAESASRPGPRGLDEDEYERTRDLLLRWLKHGENELRGWSALALGVLEHGRMEARMVPSEEVASALRARVTGRRSSSERAACIVALACLRDRAATEPLIAALLDESADETVRAYASQALSAMATLDGGEASHLVSEVFASVRGDAVALARASVALRLFGLDDVVPALLELLGSAETPEERALVARALGELRDPRAGEVLASLVCDRRASPLEREEAARALGTLYDPVHPHWTVAFARDVPSTALTWTLESPFRDGSGLLETR